VKIQIHDDGLGMSIDDFWDRFASFTVRKNPTVMNKITRRYPIGKFGIGALAFIPFVKEFIVLSKKEHEKAIKCKFDSKKIIKTTGKSYEEQISNNVKDEIISDDEWKKVYGDNSSGTIILINGVNKDVLEYLVKGSIEFWEDGKQALQSQKRKFPHLTNGLIEIAWDLASILPLKYDYDKANVYRNNKNYLKSNNPGIDVKFSDIPLRRRIFAQKDQKKKIDPVIIHFDYEKDDVKAKGIIVANPNTVKIKKANGIMIRLNNIGIGGYQFYGIKGHSTSKTRITGEIQILKGLHNELANNRETFSYYGAHFSQFREKLEKKVKEAISEASNLSEQSAGQRRQNWKEELEKNVAEIIEQTSTRRIKNTNVKGKNVTKKREYSQHKKKVTIAENEKTKPTSKSKQKKGPDNNDPIVQFKSNGQYEINQKHPVFKGRGKRQKDMIEEFLLTLKIVGISEGKYFEIIKILINLRG